MPTWNYKFELPGESYSVSDTQNYFEYLIKKLETLTDNLPVRIHVNTTEKIVALKIKTDYYLKHLTPE